MNNSQYTWVGEALKVLAPAKINLSLLIGAKRPDGFHELETVMSKIAFYDELLLEKTDRKKLELECRGKHWAPEGKDNLVLRAAEMLIDQLDDSNRAKIDTGLKITLTKNIPAGTGLGSASSDAASTLLGMKKLYDLSVSMETLSRICAALGSDIPFFLDGPLAFCWGRGEKIRKIDKKFSYRALLALPDVSVATKEVYENFRPDLSLFKEKSRQINTLIAKKNVDLIAKMCANMLETSCFDLHHYVASIKEYISSLAIGPTCLSGSGSAIFCILGDVCGENLKYYQSELKERFDCESLIVDSNRW